MGSRRSAKERSRNEIREGDIVTYNLLKQRGYLRLNGVGRWKDRVYPKGGKDILIRGTIRTRKMRIRKRARYTSTRLSSSSYPVICYSVNNKISIASQNIHFITVLCYGSRASILRREKPERIINEKSVNGFAIKLALAARARDAA